MSIARWAIFYFIKMIILMINEALKLMQSKRLWPYYIIVYYKCIHGSFNIDNDIYYYFENNIT
jgi:hypothetical protein